MAETQIPSTAAGRRLALLREIYPAVDPAAIEEKIRRLMALPAPDGVRQPGAWSETEILCITYADQVREPGVPPLHTLAEFLGHHAADVLSGVHILPHYPSSSDDGFSVMDYHAVDPAFGDWPDVARLGQQFDLMFDAVINHASAQGVWFRRYLDGKPGWESAFFEVHGAPDLSRVIRPRTLPLLTEFQTSRGARQLWTTFSADQVDLNYREPEMLLRIIQVLLDYVRHGAKYLRLDAIAFLWKEPGTTCLHLPQTHAVIRLFRAIFDEWAPGVRLITETNVPHADNISYFGDGRDEAQMVYNFALPPLVLHTFACGDAGKLSAWAADLQTPSPETTFFNFLASHDGIGLNPARGILEEAEIQALVRRTLAHGGFISEKNNPDGSRSPYEMNINFFDALNDPAGADPVDLQIARFLCACAIQVAVRGVPGIYFHSLFGSRSDRSGAERSGIPRRINREKFLRSALDAELNAGESLRRRVFSGWRRILRVRRKYPAFSPAMPQRVVDCGPGLFAIERGEAAGRVFALFNVSADTLAPALPAEWRNAKILLPEKSPDRAVDPLQPYSFRWLAE